MLLENFISTYFKGEITWLYPQSLYTIKSNLETKLFILNLQGEANKN
jgi:hypothetical protein